MNTTNNKCSSCKTSIMNVQGTVKFTCPGCAKAEITRCERCRRFATRYSCPDCKLEGPN